MKKFAMMVFVTFLLGCALIPAKVRLYGIQGPYKGCILEGTAYRKGTNQGRIVLIMPDGEICTGEYSIVAQSSYSKFSGPWNSLYQDIYGVNYVSSVEGKGQGMATALGDRGTILEVNFLADTMRGHGFGVAKDNKGNIYRVHF